MSGYATTDENTNLLVTTTVKKHIDSTLQEQKNTFFFGPLESH